MTVRIGLNLSTSAAPGADPVADARRAEELGFDFVSASDHLHGAHPTFETWTMLTWIAASTSRIDLVSNVLGLPYRSPAVLAKMVETLDRLSGGRFVLGLGAGGMDAEFAGFGLPVRTPGEKVDGLEDALHILRGMWARPAYHYEGAVYGVAGAEMEPKPAHPIPVWVGGVGPRSLRLIGRMADGWLPSMAFVPPDEVRAKREVIVAAAEEAGRDPASITWAYNVTVHVNGVLKDPERAVAGSPAAVVDRLRVLIDELGLTALNVWPAGEAGEQVELFAAEVLAHLR